MKKNHIKYISVFVPLVILPCFSQAQNNNSSPLHVIDSLKKKLSIAKEDTNKIHILNTISHEFETLSNFDTSIFYAKSAETLAQKIGYTKGLEKACVNLGNDYAEQGNHTEALKYENMALSISQQIGNKEEIANTLGNVGNVYFSNGDYPKTLEYYFNALSIFQEIGDKGGIANQYGNMCNVYYSEGNYPKALEYGYKALVMCQEINDQYGVAANLTNMANVYSYQKNYPKALDYNLQALPIYQKLGNKDGVATCLGNIGIIYTAQEKLPEALDYYSKALAMSQELGDQYGVAINLAGMGNIYYEQKSYTKALECDFKALSISRQTQDKADAADNLLHIGDIYTEQKNYKIAKEYLDSALIDAKNIGYKRYAESSYESLAKLDSATGKYNTAYGDYKNYIIYHDSLLNEESVKKTTQLEVSYTFEKREDSIKTVQEKKDIVKEAEIHRKTITTAGAIVISLLTLILAIVLINRQQIKRKNEKIVFENEKQRMENEITNSQLLLDEYIKSMMEKNRLLEQFKFDLEELKNLKSKEIDENRIERLEHLNNITILTEEDWNKFKQLFEQVHKGFFIRLKEKMPDLTPAEIRLVCLTKLKLDTKQMAGILGVSSNTILTSRYRFRKKLGLSEKDNIDEVVYSI